MLLYAVSSAGVKDKRGEENLTILSEFPLPSVMPLSGLWVIIETEKNTDREE